MPVLDSDRQVAPRSALRYRPVHTDQASSASTPVRSRRSLPVTPDAHEEQQRRRMLPAEPDVLEGTEQRALLPRSLSRKNLPVQADVQEPFSKISRSPRSAPSIQADAQKERLRPLRSARLPGRSARLHPLFWLGCALFVFVCATLALTQVLSWGTNELNTLRYGNPRTFQVDAAVGHNDSSTHPSHFLALNLKGQIEILEWPGGNASQMRVYLGPQLVGPAGEQAVVTLRFVDLNHDGRADMLITVDDSQSVLLNDQGTFRSPTPSEEQLIRNALLSSS